MNDTPQDLRLNTIDGVARAIEKLVAKGTKADTPKGPMLAAFEGVIGLVEQHGGYDAGIDRAMLKVREALGLPRKPKPTDDKETLNG